MHIAKYVPLFWRAAWVGVWLLGGTGCIDLINKEFVAASGDATGDDTGDTNDTAPDTNPSGDSNGTSDPGDTSDTGDTDPTGGDTSDTGDTGDTGDTAPDTDDNVPVVCGQGTWDHDSDPTTACVPWTTCDPGHYIVVPGSATADPMCVPCAASAFSSEPNQSACANWTVCGDDEYVAVTPSDVRDRLCVPCPKHASSQGPNAVACALEAPTFFGLTANAHYTCGIRTDTHEAQCWGVNDAGQATPPAGVAFTLISAGGQHVCGIREDSGEVQCWGLGDKGQATPPKDEKFNKISAGGQHTCGLQSDGTVKCWGSNQDENGDDNVNQSEPPGGAKFDSLSAGGYHTCGILQNTNTTECWGLNDAGQSTPAADPLSGNKLYRTLSAGGYHTCGVLQSTAMVQCWGWNSDGQAPLFATTSITRLAAGTYHTCGIDNDNKAQCWGDSTLTGAPSNVLFSALAAGIRHTCGLQASGAVQCWGAFESDNRGESNPPGASAGNTCLRVRTTPAGSSGIRAKPSAGDKATAAKRPRRKG